MHRIACFPHVETSGLHATGSIGTSNIKLFDSVFSNKRGKCLARQSITLCLHKDVIRYHLQFRHQLLATSARLERTRASCDVVVLDIDDMHPLKYCLVDSSIDVVNDVAVVLGDVILDVDNYKCFCIHIFSFHF